MDSAAASTTRRLLLALFLGSLFLLAFFILQPFLVPALWAGILVYVTWPVFVRLRAKLKERAALAAFLMTLLLSLVLVLPTAWVLLLVRGEATAIYQKILLQLNQGHFVLAPELRNIPWLGAELGAFFDRLNADPAELKAQLKNGSDYLREHAGVWAGGVGRNLAKLGLTLLTAFFFYRDGEAFVRQIREVLQQVLGQRIDGYLAAMGSTARAVVYGIVLTAAAQGALAGVGYAVAGTENPMFLACITMLAAMIPFGTPVVWGSICVWLFVQGHTFAALGLTAWCLVVVSWIDNIIRPLVISSATKIPFLLVMFGVLGGLAAFGMIGLFMGPVILAVMIAVWREWLHDAETAQ